MREAKAKLSEYVSGRIGAAPDAFWARYDADGNALREEIMNSAMADPDVSKVLLGYGFKEDDPRLPDIKLAAWTETIASLRPKASPAPVKSLVSTSEPSNLTESSSAETPKPIETVAPISTPNEVDQVFIQSCIGQAIMYAKLPKPEFENSLKELAKAEAKDPNRTYFDLWHNKGAILIAMANEQHYAEAEKCLIRAVELSPTNQFAWFHLAVVRARAGVFDAALAALEQAGKNGFSDKSALESELGKFEAIKNSAVYSKLLSAAPASAK